MEQVLGAELPKWAVTAGLKPKARDGILRFNTEREADQPPDRSFVPVALRVPWIQRMHVGEQAKHVGYKRTLANLVQRHIWGNIATHVQNALKMCVQHW